MEDSKNFYQVTSFNGFAVGQKYWVLLMSNPIEYTLHDNKYITRYPKHIANIPIKSLKVHIDINYATLIIDWDINCFLEEAKEFNTRIENLEMEQHSVVTFRKDKISKEGGIFFSEKITGPHQKFMEMKKKVLKDLNKVLESTTWEIGRLEKTLSDAYVNVENLKNAIDSVTKYDFNEAEEEAKLENESKCQE